MRRSLFIISLPVLFFSLATQAESPPFRPKRKPAQVEQQPTVPNSQISQPQDEQIVNQQSTTSAPVIKRISNWSFLLPTFVIHGIAPGSTVATQMPRKFDSKGQSVLTPGFGFEYKGEKSLDVITAFVKDCYDNYAGTFQVGQYFELGKTSEFGYTLGLYVRETPVTCYTTTTYTSGGGGGGGGGGGNHSPPKVNSFTSKQCLFQDNLPWRYTFKSSSGYIDVIPSPFLNFTTRLYRGSFDVNLKLISNFYLNEFGIAIPF